MLSMLVVIMLLISGAFLALKLVPLYVDDYAIGKAVTSLAEEPNLYAKSKSEIRSFLRLKLAAEFTASLDDENIQITKDKNTINVDVVYETKVPLVRNLSVVANFEHHIEKSK